MENYQSNSYKSKAKAAPEKKDVKKVISGTAKIKKKSALTKFTEVFIPEDIDSVKDYIFFDVMIPAAKKFLSDSVDALLYGGSRKSKGGMAGRVSFIDYNKASTRDRDRYSGSSESSESRGTHSSTDVIFESRGDAEAVLMAMDELIGVYGVVSIADFNDLCEVSGQYTDNNYGWMNITSAKVVPTRDGYIIKMPKAKLLD